MRTFEKPHGIAYVFSRINWGQGRLGVVRMEEDW